MKFYLPALIMVILFPSCLKESIADAMISKNSDQQNATTATLSYNLNGNAVNIVVKDADNQNRNIYTLGCSKQDYYTLDASGSLGELTFTFYTDSLTVGNYKYSGVLDVFVTDNINVPEYVHDASDSISFNITSYSNGHISGNFSGVLTPLITAGNPNNVFGIPGSVLITNGSFQNVPVFY
jgi:hypothetical protein